jgi:preprotein translocase subunit SecB
MSERDTEAQAGAGDEGAAGQEGRRMQIEKVYLKDVSFESPAAPGLFSAASTLQPQVSLQLNTETQQVGDTLYDLTLVVTVTGTAEERTIFLVEVKQAGLFRIEGFEEEQRAQLLGAYCPSILFPFAREVVADLVQKGGLPQLVLQPINFEALYAQHQRQQGGAEPSPAEE